MKILIVSSMLVLTWLFGSIGLGIIRADLLEVVRESKTERVVKKESRVYQEVEMIFPDKTWKRETPQKVGWSSEKFDKAKEYFENLNAESCVVIVNGRMLASWGDESKPVDNRSMRKFYLGSLIGIYSGRGKIDVTKTLNTIGIDEKTPLTELEKSATIEDLLTSSSGIYLPAAFEAPSSSKSRPDRGSNPPGKTFYYNNWDFNALSTVFKKETGEELFGAFERDIAGVLQMQDYKPDNGKYLYEKESLHPAYIFETSARDDARVGLLWLNNGQWNGQQVIPKEWIEKATTPRFNFTNPRRFPIRDGYGYLTWIDRDAEGNLIGYSALGNSGQFLYVSVKHNAVIALRADPGSIFKKWFGLRLDPSESYRLIDLILDAKE